MENPSWTDIRRGISGLTAEAGLGGRTEIGTSCSPTFPEGPEDTSAVKNWGAAPRNRLDGRGRNRNLSWVAGNTENWARGRGKEMVPKKYQCSKAC